MAKSKIQKTSLLCAALAFAGFLFYDFYVNKNNTETKTPPLSIAENATSGDDNLKNNKIKNVKQKKSKTNKTKRKRKASKKSNKKKANSNRPININTATASELCNGLKGIGKAKAKLIILYRNKMGKFSNIEEIKNIKGIGEKTFRNLAGSITV